MAHIITVETNPESTVLTTVPCFLLPPSTHTVSVQRAFFSGAAPGSKENLWRWLDQMPFLSTIQQCQSTLASSFLHLPTVYQQKDVAPHSMPALRRLKALHHNHFTALFPEPPGWAGARKELLDFMVHAKINRGRHIDRLAGRHYIQT